MTLYSSRDDTAGSTHHYLCGIFAKKGGKKVILFWSQEHN